VVDFMTAFTENRRPPPAASDGHDGRPARCRRPRRLHNYLADSGMAPSVKPRCVHRRLRQGPADLSAWWKAEDGCGNCGRTNRLDSLQDSTRIRERVGRQRTVSRRRRQVLQRDECEAGSSNSWPQAFAGRLDSLAEALREDLTSSGTTGGLSLARPPQAGNWPFPVATDLEQRPSYGAEQKCT